MKHITALILLSFMPTSAFAANEYLNGQGGHCQSATLSPYIEWNKNDNAAGDSDNGGGSASQFQNSDGLRFGFQLQIPLGSTCTKKYKDAMLKNELLKQQLEMLKLCARYKDLELGPEFADVRNMCADVKKKQD